MILKGTSATLRTTVYVDGTATALSSNGTVTVTDAAGNEIATGPGVTGGTGIVTFSLTPTHTEDVNRLTVTWEDLQIGASDPFTLTTTEEVVGELLFTEAEARAFDGGAMPESGGTINYTDQQIRDARTRIHDGFETILGYPLGRRYYRETLGGSGDAILLLDRGEVLTVRDAAYRSAGGVTWTEFTAAELADIFLDPGGLLIREARGTWPRGRQNVRVGYEAGRSIHPELKRAALLVLRNQLVPSNIPDRALSISTQDGSYGMAVADSSRNHWYGLPEVDSVLQRHRLPVVY